jgi:O-antigen ligase
MSIPLLHDSGVVLRDKKSPKKVSKFVFLFFTQFLLGFYAIALPAFSPIKILIAIISFCLLFPLSFDRRSFEKIYFLNLFLLPVNLNGFDYSDVLIPLLFFSALFQGIIRFPNLGKMKLTSILFTVFIFSLLVANAINPGNLANIIKFLVSCMFVATSVSYIRDHQKFYKLLNIFVYGIIASCSLSLFFTFLGRSRLLDFMDFNRDNRFFGMIGDPNILMVILIFGIFIVLINFTDYKNRILKIKGIFVAFSMFILLTSVILSESRSGWFGLVISLILFSIFMLLRRKIFLFLILNLTFFISIIAIPILAFNKIPFANNIIERIDTVISPQSSVESQRISSFYALSALEVAWVEPFGIGTDNTEKDERIEIGDAGVRLRPHNTFVQILVDVGWVAFVCVVFIVGTIFFLLRNKLNFERNGILPLAFGAALTGIICQALFYDFLYWIVVWIPFVSTYLYTNLDSGGRNAHLAG